MIHRPILPIADGEGGGGAMRGAYPSTTRFASRGEDVLA